MARHPCIAALLVATGILAGCQHQQVKLLPVAEKSSVSYEAVADKQLSHYQVSTGQAVSSPVMGSDNPTPVYPPQALALKMPTAKIHTLLIVGRDGRVREVRIPAAEAEGPTALFATSVAAATLQWHFTPLLISDWQEQPDGSSRRIATTPKPFSQSYVFRFAIVDGKPQVITGDSAASSP